MTNRVAADSIELIVGVGRHWIHHYGKAVSAERQVYILHSEVCLAARDDLRTCPFSIALDKGIDREDWEEFEDLTVELQVTRDVHKRLIPVYFP